MPADNRNLPSGFQISTPVRSQREWGGKGKGKAFDPVGTPVLSSMVPDHLSHPALPLPTQPVQEASVIPNRSGQEDVFIADGTSDTFAPIDVDALNDVEMEGEGENLALTPVEEESEQWDPPNWNFIVRPWSLCNFVSMTRRFIVASCHTTSPYEGFNNIDIAATNDSLDNGSGPGSRV